MNGAHLPSQQHLVGQGILIIKASRSHSDTSHWVGLLWMYNQSNTETSHITQHSPERDIHAPGGIQTHKSFEQVAPDPSLRPRGH